MNENETDPHAADASAGSSSPERGQSEQPTASQPPAGEQAATAQSPANPWQQPTAQVPYGQHAGYQPQYPAGYPAAGGYGPGYGQQAAGQQPGYQPQYPQQAAYAGGWATGQTSQQPTTEGQPPWAYPVGAGPEPRNPGRNRKIFVAGAAAVVLALSAGGIGALTALSFDHTDASNNILTSNSTTSRVVDRSSLAEIAASVQDSVVSIKTQTGEGSGVILSADGSIVTNNHVVATAQSSTVTVIFADGKKASATITGTDPRSDLAVVKATGVSNLHAARFGKSANMKVGDTVLALGSPLGLEGSVTAGIISAKDRTIKSSSEGSQQQQQQSPFGGQSQQQQQGATSTTMSGLLQTDAPINPGNSGGALVNTSGEVIGINSAIATQGSGSGNIGLGFAIPSDKVALVVNALLSGNKVSHPALSVGVTDGENGGALISNVTPNGAGAKAGLEQGDVVTAVDGKAVGSANDLVATVQGATVGQKMTLDFTRNGAKKTVTVTLTEAP